MNGIISEGQMLRLDYAAYKNNDGKISQTELARLISQAKAFGGVDAVESEVLLMAITDHFESGQTNPVDAVPNDSSLVADVSPHGSSLRTTIREASGRYYITQGGGFAGTYQTLVVETAEPAGPVEPESSCPPGMHPGGWVPGSCLPDGAVG